MGEGRTVGGGPGGDKAESGRRLTVPEAAAQIGTTEEGVRSRIKRGTLQAERESGRVWVILDADQPRPDPAQAGAQADLVDELRERVAFLEGELERRGASEAELRRIIAALTSRIPELEPPGSPESASEPSPSSTGTGPPEAERPAETRPWWRRVFGG